MRTNYFYKWNQLNWLLLRAVTLDQVSGVGLVHQKRPTDERQHSVRPARYDLGATYLAVRLVSALTTAMHAGQINIGMNDGARSLLRIEFGRFFND